MEFTSKSGHVYTDEELDAIAEEFERDPSAGGWGDWIIRPVGRPTSEAKELVSVTFKMTPEARAEVDAAAEAQHQTRSEFIRKALADAVHSMVGRAAVL